MVKDDMAEQEWARRFRKAQPGSRQENHEDEFSWNPREEYVAERREWLTISNIAQKLSKDPMACKTITNGL